MTEKKTLSARNVVADIRAGATDEFLMKKYGVSEKGLQSLFQKLITAKVMTHADLENRKSGIDQLEAVLIEEDEPKPGLPTSASTQTVFQCPSCSLPQNYDFKICPQCGIIVEKFLKKKASETGTGESARDPSAVGERSERPAESAKIAWYEQGAVVILSLLIFFPIGLYLLWKSSRFNPRTKVIVTGSLATLLLLGIILPTDRTNRSRSGETVKDTGLETRGQGNPSPARTSDGKSPRTVADCEEPEISFPVQPVGKNAPGSEVLSAIIRTKVILGPSSNFGYLSERARRNLESILSGREPPAGQLIQYILETEYKCPPPGGSSQHSEAASLLAGCRQDFESIIHKIASEKLAPAFPEERGRTHNKGGKNWIPPSQSTKLQGEMDTESSDYRIKKLVYSLRNRGLDAWATGFQGLSDLVRASFDQGIAEKQKYSQAQEGRKARIGQCRERVVAEERQRHLRAADEARKRAAAEQERRQQEAEHHVRDIKSGKAPVKSITDLQIKLAVADGEDYVEKPPTATPQDSRYLLFRGTIETQQGNVIICNGRESMFDEGSFKIRKWAFRADGLKEYLPRINEDVKVVGKIAGVMSGTTVIGKTVHWVVVDAIAVEAEGGKFYQR